jgi:hypothetical protein
MKTEEKENPYMETAVELANLVKQKNEAYGDSFARSGACLREMYPNGIKPWQYDDMMAITRILDKLFRIASNEGAFGENPWSDICGYALLKTAGIANRKKVKS